MPDCAVMSEQGVQEGTEHTPPRGPRARHQKWHMAAKYRSVFFQLGVRDATPWTLPQSHLIMSAVGLWKVASSRNTKATSGVNLAQERRTQSFPYRPRRSELGHGREPFKSWEQINRLVLRFTQGFLPRLFMLHVLLTVCASVRACMRACVCVCSSPVQGLLVLLDSQMIDGCPLEHGPCKKQKRNTYVKKNYNYFSL